MQGDHVVASGEQLQRLVVITTADEIGDKEDYGAFLEDARKEIDRSGQVSAGALRTETENLANDAHGAGRAFDRGDEELGAVGEEQQPDFVVVFHGREGEGGAQFGSQVVFGTLSCTVIS